MTAHAHRVNVMACSVHSNVDGLKEKKEWLPHNTIWVGH